MIFHAVQLYSATRGYRPPSAKSISSFFELHFLDGDDAQGSYTLKYLCHCRGRYRRKSINRPAPPTRVQTHSYTSKYCGEENFTRKGVRKNYDSHVQAARIFLYASHLTVNSDRSGSRFASSDESLQHTRRWYAAVDEVGIFVSDTGFHELVLVVVLLVQSNLPPVPAPAHRPPPTRAYARKWLLSVIAQLFPNRITHKKCFKTMLYHSLHGHWHIKI